MNEKNKVNFRNGRPTDHDNIIAVMPEWWGGRDLSSSVLKVFFIHFSDTVYVAECDNEIVGFLVGFLSQTEKDVGIIHFAGVHPKFRKAGIARSLYQRFYETCKTVNRSIVKSCTSPVNKLSINFHQRLGFTIEPSDDIIDGVAVQLQYSGKGDPLVFFRKELDKK